MYKSSKSLVSVLQLLHKPFVLSTQLIMILRYFIYVTVKLCNIVPWQAEGSSIANQKSLS